MKYIRKVIETIDNKRGKRGIYWYIHNSEEKEISVTVGSFLTEHGVEWMVKEGVVCELCEKKEKKCFLTEHGVEWMVKEGVVCESCEKKEKKCFWRMEARRGKACLACHSLKKSCTAGRAEDSEAEAGPLKRRKVEGEGGNSELRSCRVRRDGCPAGHPQGVEGAARGGW